MADDHSFVPQPGSHAWRMIELARRRPRTYTDDSSYVYLVSYVVGPYEHIKIGIAKNLKRRLAALQTAVPMELELEFSLGPFPRWQAVEIEKKAQAALKDHRMHGEWFGCSVAYGVHAIHSAAPSLLIIWEETAPSAAPSPVIHNPSTGRELLADAGGKPCMAREQTSRIEPVVPPYQRIE